MNLGSGVYTITNVAHLNRARLPNDNHGESIVGKIPYGNDVALAEQWYLEFSPPNRYIVRNMQYQRYLSTEICPKLNGAVFGASAHYWWNIDADTLDQDVYRIHTSGLDSGALTLALADGRDHTPIDLTAWSSSRQALWKVEPYPPVLHNDFPFDDRSSLALELMQQVPNKETIAVQLGWRDLPRNYVLQFPQPFSVISLGEVVAEAEADGEFKTNSQIFRMTLRVKDTAAFRTFASSVLHDDEVQVTLQFHGFRFYPADPGDRPSDWNYVYRKPWNKDLIFKGLQSFRNQISLSEFQILGSNKTSHESYMQATVLVEVSNTTRLACTANIAVEIYYGDAKIGAVDIENFQIRPERPTTQEVEWRFRPLSPANQEVQKFMANAFTTRTELPLKLRIENISVNICGRLFNLPRFEVNSQIRGLGLRLVRHVDVYLQILNIIFRRKVSFEFEFENPVNTKLEFHSIDLSVAIKGAHIATVKHTFQDTFIISAKGRRRSPRIADAYLVAGIIQTLQMGTESNACLDVAVKSASVTIDNFRLDGLTFELDEIPYNLH